MKQPKYKFGDKLISAGGAVFEVTTIRMGNYGDYYYRYKDHHLDIAEENLSLYVEPKQKVKMWQYAFQMDDGRWTTSNNFYKDDADFQKILLHVKQFKKLEWSMIEVECD